MVSAGRHTPHGAKPASAKSVGSAFVPLFCTSAENNIGVARMMDIIAKYGSSPVDRANVDAVNGDGNKIEVSLTDADPVLDRILAQATWRT